MVNTVELKKTIPPIPALVAGGAIPVTIVSIEPDDPDFVWIQSAHGIHRFNSSKLTLTEEAKTRLDQHRHDVESLTCRKTSR